MCTFSCSCVGVRLVSSSSAINAKLAFWLCCVVGLPVFCKVLRVFYRNGSEHSGLVCALCECIHYTSPLKKKKNETTRDQSRMFPIDCRQEGVGSPLGRRGMQLPTWLNMPRTLCLPLSLSLSLPLPHGHSGPSIAGLVPGPCDTLSVVHRLTSGHTTMHWSESAGTTSKTAFTACGTLCPHCKGKRLVEAWL